MGNRNAERIVVRVIQYEKLDEVAKELKKSREFKLCRMFAIVTGLRREVRAFAREESHRL